jgi:hypothetical protein
MVTKNFNFIKTEFSSSISSREWCEMGWTNSKTLNYFTWTWYFIGLNRCVFILRSTLKSWSLRTVTTMIWACRWNFSFTGLERDLRNTWQTEIRNRRWLIHCSWSTSVSLTKELSSWGRIFLLWIVILLTCGKAFKTWFLIWRKY